MRAETRGKGGSQSPHWRERHSGQWEPQMQRPWGRSMPGELEQQHTSMWEQLTTALVKWLKRGKWHPWFLQADSTVLLSEARVKITPAPSPAPYRLGEHSHWHVLSKWPVNGSLFPHWREGNWRPEQYFIHLCTPKTYQSDQDIFGHPVNVHWLTEWILSIYMHICILLITLRLPYTKQKGTRKSGNLLPGLYLCADAGRRMEPVPMRHTWDTAGLSVKKRRL